MKNTPIAVAALMACFALSCGGGAEETQEELNAVGSDLASYTLTVRSVDLDKGNTVFQGMWTVIARNGTTVKTGYTSLSASLPSASYTVSVGNYQNYVFDHWENGSTSPRRSVALSKNRTVTAYYRSGGGGSSAPAPDPGPFTLTVKAVDLDKNNAALDGMWTVISQNGSTVKTGYTPLSVTLAKGTYSVSVGNYQNLVFDHWDDQSTSSSRSVNLSANATLTAYYHSGSTGGSSPPPTDPGPFNLTVKAVDLDQNNAALNGMWTVISQNGSTVKTGYTPLSVTLDKGTYSVSVSNYQNLVFDHWDDQSTSSSRTVTLSADTTLTAYYHSGTTSAPPPPSGGGGTTLTGTGTIVPLYTYPGPTWDALINAHQAHPSVPIVAVVNPANGPGGGRDANYANGINRLRNAGITVLGYVYTKWTARDIYAVQNDINTWGSFYTIDGIFFDEMANGAGGENYYRTLHNFVKNKGYKMTVGNPGADTASSYVGTMDVILIYESAGYPSLSSLGGWHTNYDRKNFGIIPYAVGLDTNFVKNAKQYVGYIYATNDGGSNPWDSLPSYFSSLLGALE